MLSKTASQAMEFGQVIDFRYAEPCIHITGFCMGVWTAPLQWCQNECNGISNHRHLNGLLNRLFRRTSKKTSKSTSLAFVKGIHWWLVDSHHRGPVNQKMFLFDDVIMETQFWKLFHCHCHTNHSNLPKTYPQEPQYHEWAKECLIPCHPY